MEELYSTLGLLEPEDDEEHDKFLKKNGFWGFKCKEEGDYPYFGYILHGHSNRKIWLGDIAIGEDVNEFIIIDFPSLFMFLKEVEGIFKKSSETTKFIKLCNSNRFISKDKIEVIRICGYKDEKDYKTSIDAWIGDEEYSLLSYGKDWQAQEIKEELSIE